MVEGDRCRVPPCDDDLLLERFIGCAMDLVCGYFKDQQALERNLRLIAEAARGCKSVWEESGCDAFQALVGGLDREVSPEKVRRWARLLEGLLRRLFVMAGQTPPDRDTVRDLLEAAGLLSGNEPGYAVVPERLGRARAADQLADETLKLCMLRAADYRNADAHNRWRPMDRRERFELAETVILTLLCMLKRYPPILKRLVFERATQDVPECITGTEQTLELDWRWTFAGLEESGSTSALIDRMLDRAWPEGSRLVVKGALGIGLTTLGKRLIGAALSGENRSMLLVRANIEPSPGPGTDRSGQPLGRQQDAAVTLERILGDLWPTWWLQSALREGWLGIVLDGLDRLDTADLNN